MKKLAINAFIVLLVLVGISYFLNKKSAEYKPVAVNSDGQQIAIDPNAYKEKTDVKSKAIFEKNNKHELDKIGQVINDKTAQLDPKVKEEIKVEKTKYTLEMELKEKQKILEQSFYDKASSLNDLKGIQYEIVGLKNKLKIELKNSEKWDPALTFYLMIQENYTYAEINQIKALNENGISNEELAYINEITKAAPFKERIKQFRQQYNDESRAIASKKDNNTDEFLNGKEDSGNLEAKIIEMNYNQ